MGEYALYCGLGDRVAVLTYTKQEGKKHLLLEKDLAAYGTSGKSRTRRRRITPEEQKSCRAPETDVIEHPRPGKVAHAIQIVEQVVYHVPSVYFVFFFLFLYRQRFSAAEAENASRNCSMSSKCVRTPLTSW